MRWELIRPLFCVWKLRANKRLVPRQNGDNNYFGPMADAGYLSCGWYYDFFRKIYRYIFVPMLVIHRAGNSYKQKTDQLECHWCRLQFSPPPRLAKIVPFVILLCLMPDGFTCQRWDSRWETVKLCWLHQVE